MRSILFLAMISLSLCQLGAAKEEPVTIRKILPTNNPCSYNPNCTCTVHIAYTAGRIEKSRSATKAQPELANTMAPRAPVKYHGFAPEAGRLKSISRGDSRFQMVPRAKPGRPGG
ncbi:hypothetical protein PGT21_013539 [Puccinia graminis f. sp. tritici]|uniref:Uncharacterized protein n=1 Tax=Puccinia graminis f. sp. tritici TaxID=56615 RepID=A0A5B0PXL5_PUCGR|nr:hypothetical protein PGT21_013539 [Puccinia graminis f. sp. tritici]KAA1125161.1 hypothetical protein PGTUg99_006283 [Puccinia graminis f. sp. tritici]